MCKISTRESLAYGFGDVANNMTYTFLNIYLLIFYTDVFGISPAEAATLFLVARIWDAINDPIIGYFVDKTKTRYGRFRPWVGIFAFPVVASAVAVFTVPDLGHTGKLVYAYVTYIGYGMLYSAVIVPYLSMISAMSEDSTERTKITGTRMALVMLFSISVAAVPGLVDGLGGGDEAKGWQLTMMAFAAFGLVCYVFCFSCVRERVDVAANDKEDKASIRELLNYFNENRAFVVLFVMFFLMFANQIIATSSGMYLFTYLFDAKDIFPMFVVGQLLCIVAGVLLSKKLIEKYDPKYIFMAGAAIAATRAFAVYTGDLTTVLATVPHTSIGQGMMAGVIFGFVPDALEYGRKKTGLNIVGVGNALVGFFYKFGSAIGGVVPGFILSAYNYVPNEVQTEESLRGITHMGATAPLITLLLLVAITALYPLTQKSLNETEAREATA